jgi:hypothetical protein
VTEGAGRRLAAEIGRAWGDCSGGDCLRVGEAGDGQKVLYSTRRSGSIVVDADEFKAFLLDVKGGRYG